VTYNGSGNSKITKPSGSDRIPNTAYCSTLTVFFFPFVVPGVFKNLFYRYGTITATMKTLTAEIMLIILKAADAITKRVPESLVAL
jgi:hypothetical protein